MTSFMWLASTVVKSSTVYGSTKPIGQGVFAQARAGLAEEFEERTTAEEVEEHRLKKLKLRLKDEMEQIVSEYKLQHAS